MITVFYHPATNTWGHQEENSNFRWGHTNTTLNKITNTNDLVSFSLKKQGQRVGPIVGILTSEHRNKLFSGNVSTFRRIDYALKKKGGICIVFTPTGLRNNSVTGYVYVNDRWQETTLPLPDIIYNRVPHYIDEKSNQVQHAINGINSKRIPFFNPHFFNKWSIYQLLLQNKELVGFLPKTHLYDKRNLFDWLKKYRKVYLKPCNGQKGDGIFVVSITNQNTFLLETNEITTTFFSFEHLLANIEGIIAEKEYLLQQAIKLPKYRERIYDFRVHVQRLQDGWSVTGIGIRSAKKGGVTTHVPNGGVILSNNVIFPPVNKQIIQQLSEKIAESLEAQYGKIGEFSLDIGRDSNNNYWIFEVNSKPMLFDEPTIQKKGLLSLINTFYTDSGF